MVLGPVIQGDFHLTFCSCNLYYFWAGDKKKGNIANTEKFQFECFDKGIHEAYITWGKSEGRRFFECLRLMNLLSFSQMAFASLKS